MPPAPTAQLSTKVTDWVKCQALEDRKPDAAGAFTIAEATSKPSKSTTKRYDLETLLKLRCTSNVGNIELRIHPAALQEQIFKPVPFAPLPRVQKRPRGLSDMSLNSLHDIPSDEEVIYRRVHPARMPFAPPETKPEALRLNFVNRFPRRQPRSPPGDSLAQHHDGFARFLKEHASPPHQRVTAGGRIVPASGPPPMFNVDFLRGPAMSPMGLDSSATTQSVRTAQPTNEKVAATSKTAQPTTFEVATKENLASTQPLRNDVAVQVNGSNIISANGQGQLQIYTAPQISMQSTPFLLADGSQAVIQNGIPYRVYWNGFQTISEPLVFPPSAIPELTGCTPQYSIANPYANTSTPTAPITLADATNAQDVPFQQSRQHIPDHALERLQEALRYELKKLDKHIALRSQTFSTLEHASYVAQRKRLIEQMDNIRVTRGGRGGRSSSGSRATEQGSLRTVSTAPTQSQVAAHSALGQNRSSSQSARTDGRRALPHVHEVSAGPPWDDLVNGTMHALPAPISSMGPQQKTPPARKGLGASSVLSPDAPPFVPSSMQATTARNVESCISSIQQEGTRANKVDESSLLATPTLEYGTSINGDTSKVAMASASADKDRQKEHPLGTNGTRSNGKAGRSTSGSAMDDVVPMVHQADIAYVDNLGLNPVQDPKIYCSTITEFQEVIRRVREQARLYGCEGGQSKDPEFDAEQDVRWAMADSTPIPLPKKVPDHIAHPRPWNWNDSAFNIRADRSHLRSTKPSFPLERIGEDQILSKSVEHGNKASTGNTQEISGLVDTAFEFSEPGVSNKIQHDVYVSKSEETDNLDVTNTILGKRSASSPNAATRARDSPEKSSVDTAGCSPIEAALNREAAWKNLIPKPNVQNIAADKGVIPSRIVSMDSASNPSRRRAHRAYIGDNTKIPKPPIAVPLIVVGEGKDDKGSIHAGTQASKGEKSGRKWTKEDQAAIDAAYGDPFKRPPTPEGWSDIPLPPEVLSKTPFRLDDFQRGQRGDPFVHVPKRQHFNLLNTESKGTAVSDMGSRPLGYNEHTPISIPAGSTSTGAPSFLRDMLKNPRYSTTSARQQSSPSAGRQVYSGEGSSSNKENFRCNSKLGGSTNNIRIPANAMDNLYFSKQHPHVTKAQSSVAPSSHNAQGYLPQYPSPGNPRSLDYYMRYQAPRAYGSMQEGYPGLSQARLARFSSRQILPQYDGGADSPPPHAKAPLDGGEQAEGKNKAHISPQVFQTEDGKLPAGHSYAVDRLFQTIRDTERKEMSGQDQKDPKSPRV